MNQPLRYEPQYYEKLALLVEDKQMAVALALRAAAAQERENDNAREAFTLLGLIDAEFRSDPMSVQCFDLSIVRRVRACVETHEKEHRQ